MRLRLLPLVFAVALSALVAASPVRAEDDTDTTMAKARIASFDKSAGKAKDAGKFADLLMEVASFSHALTAERVGRVLLKDKDEEHQMIAAEAMGYFKKPEEVRLQAGKILLTAIDDDPSVDVKDSCVAAIGKLNYKDAVPTLCSILKKGGDPWLMVTAVRVCGSLEDMRALPQLLELWERFPVGDKWEGGETSVDTGASGDADQQAAEAQYNAEHGGQHRRGKPPMMLRAYIQELSKAVKRITKDEDIHTPKDLRAWMEARADEFKKLGIEIPKKKGPTKDPKKDKDGKDGKDEKDAAGDASKDAPKDAKK